MRWQGVLPEVAKAVRNLEKPQNTIDVSSAGVIPVTKQVLLVCCAVTGSCAAGLQQKGLLVVMPVNMQLSACLSWPPPSLTAAVFLTILPLHLSPSVVSSLIAIATAIKQSATLPGGYTSQESSDNSASLPTPAQHGMQKSVEHEGVKNGSHSIAAAAAAAAAPAVETDDLRCGLFSMAPALAARPGTSQLQT